MNGEVEVAIVDTITVKSLMLNKLFLPFCFSNAGGAKWATKSETTQSYR